MVSKNFSFSVEDWCKESFDTFLKSTSCRANDAKIVTFQSVEDNRIYICNFCGDGISVMFTLDPIGYV